MSTRTSPLLRVTNGAVFRDGRLLVVRRSPHDSFAPELWELPGGVVERGETFRDATLREVYEETGLRGRSLRLFRAHEFWSPVRHYLRVRERDFLVLGSPRTPTRLAPTEHCAFRWVSLTEIERLPTLPRKRETLRRAFVATFP
ncbi:MAG TPA: NUDIX hydrolase [Thermoplasmata archaeon]